MVYSTATVIGIITILDTQNVLISVIVIRIDREMESQLVLNREAGVALQCHFCGYMWKCRSKLIFASCPSCRHAVKVRSVKENNPGPRDQPETRANSSARGTT
jgi:hypothetical protein